MLRSQHLHWFGRWRQGGWEVRREMLHHPKLLVGNSHNHDFALLGEHLLDVACMCLSLLHTRAVAYVDGVLKHREAIL